MATVSPTAADLVYSKQTLFQTIVDLIFIMSYSIIEPYFYFDSNIYIIFMVTTDNQYVPPVFILLDTQIWTLGILKFLKNFVINQIFLNL